VRPGRSMIWADIRSPFESFVPAVRHEARSGATLEKHPKNTKAAVPSFRDRPLPFRRRKSLLLRRRLRRHLRCCVGARFRIRRNCARHYRGGGVDLPGQVKNKRCDCERHLLPFISESLNSLKKCNQELKIFVLQVNGQHSSIRHCICGLDQNALQLYVVVLISHPNQCWCGQRSS